MQPLLKRTVPAAPSEELDEIRSLAEPVTPEHGLEPLLDRVGDARFVLIGEASHGTSDYYRWRAALTRRLIEDHGFSFVAVEGDWPDCFAINRWVKGHRNQAHDARRELSEFERWPTWMWANEDVADFAGWLRAYNLRHGATVGFYGLDVYSLWESLHRVVRYLDERHPEAVESAFAAMRCFEPYGGDPQDYARAAALVPSRCEDEVVELLAAMHRVRPLSADDPEAELDARQNAEVLVGAERYYRSMLGGGGGSWNVRDRHMTDTLDRLMTHHGPGAKAVVWEHNTHVGDARGTDMAAAGMVNVGQLVRERHGADEVVLVGLGGHRGTVMAARAWGAPMQRMPVPAAPAGMHEDLLSVLEAPSLLVFPDDRRTPWLSSRRGHRAIGVVYDPRRDAYGNWVPTVMGDRYDAFVSFADTEAVHPLHREASQPAGERETYPWSE